VSEHQALSCRELVELVTEYLEGALPAPERDRFESHIATCPDCTNYLAQMRTTIRLSGVLTEESLSPTARAQLLVAFRTWKVR